jgi:hypothetical protein
MMDLETYGLTPGCVVRSVGATTFTLEGDHEPKTFYANISATSCLFARLHIEQGTHEWWAGQSAEAQESLKRDQRPLRDVVKDFNAWVVSGCGLREATVRVWSQGSNFDVVLWEAAARAVGVAVPWRFYNCRDTRTLYELAGFDPWSIKRAGTYHNALDDARHQVECCRAAWEKLKKVKDSG